ncbi:hypothetical protein CEQ90_01105 [Lewinellaceae bacterium SD302]|nr:hypothetical protein CEQ90_01105 [Lewinellaceae bacterium SD302]
MKVFKLTSFFTLLLLGQLNAQNTIVAPYLQDAEPSRVTISWETDGGSNGELMWGILASNLNQSQTATSISTGDGNLLFSATATGLLPNTRYYYRVKTENVFSSVFDFLTPPTNSSDQSFSMVVMSDMQKDGSQPLKFQEVVNEGVIDFFEAENGENDIAAHLGFVMIPGDLVVNGNSHSQWQNDFFGQASQLIRHVPVYPVLGNHENNSNRYFQYFTLPENGSPGFTEHWWFKDYSNARIIGLNSNSGFRIQEQLDWLENTLDDACQNPDIDFVFAQLHHPFLSELWTPGELGYTGDAIALLESFSTDCGKPSIHFFGHTHGYSRGQSRDHNHLWVNAATAGGAIDNWGEFPNQDYAEFSKSIDEYGFVVVDVTAGATPEFRLRRITRGDQDVVIDNQQQDAIVIRRGEQSPQMPTGLFPSGNGISPACIILSATAFNDAGDQHQAAHWQISTNCADFSAPVFDSWKQHENFYNEVNTQADDDLTDEQVTNLEENTDYCWRVRYRDEHLEWSDWSTPLSFSTGTSGFSANLLSNPGGENGTTNWTASTGSIESLTSGECDGVNPFAGSRYFAVGGLCEGNETSFSEAVQNIDVSGFAGDIDGGGFFASFGGHLSNFNGNDRPAMRLEFLAASGASLATTGELTTLSSSWIALENTVTIPATTRSINVLLTGTRNSGTDNDSYFDELFLRLGGDNGECAQSPLPVEILSLQAYCAANLTRIDWSVTEEIDIAEYRIERRLPGGNWENIGTVNPRNSNTSVSQYNFNDDEKSNGEERFYRLRIVEVDGGSRLTKIMTSDCGENSPKVALSPNPLIGNRLKIEASGFPGPTADLLITNTVGQTFYSDKITVEAGRRDLVLWTADWPAGQYFVQLGQGNLRWSGKLIKVTE